MFERFLTIATGRSHYATLFLVIYMFIVPAAVFTDYLWLDSCAWFMTIVLGVFILITGIVNIQEGLNSHHWPRAYATLKSASLTFHSSSKGGRSYAPKINCSFMVDNQEYMGVEYDFSSSYGAKEKAQQKVDEIKDMRPLLVHYKPTDPSINVIHPGLHFVAYLRLLLGIAAIIISTLSWAGYIHYS